MSDIHTYSHADWLGEGRRRFGDNALDWRFVCPFCGNVASCRDWKNAGGDPQRAYVECIGRLVGAKGGLTRDREQPCDWAAFGLFGTLNGGARVVRDGRTVNVFDFAGDTGDSTGGTMRLTAQQQAHACVSLGYSEGDILALLRDDYQLDQQAAAAVLATAKDSVLGQEAELYEAEQHQEDR